MLAVVGKRVLGRGGLFASGAAAACCRLLSMPSRQGPQPWFLSCTYAYTHTHNTNTQFTEPYKFQGHFEFRELKKL